MDRPTRGADPPAGGPPGPPVALAEPRQRWRITYARGDHTDVPHRAVADAWIAALADRGLPLARGEGRPKPALTFAAPLPVGVIAEAELADLVLAERLPVADVRDAVVAAAPPGVEVADVHDVWLGAPALAAALEAADYRVELLDPPPEPELERGALDLLSAPRLDRERARASGPVRYDLRPLLDGISVDGSALRIRTRFDPERGAGRPEEVVAALGERVGRPIAIGGIVRERLILGDGRRDDPPPARRGRGRPSGGSAAGAARSG